VQAALARAGPTGTSGRTGLRTCPCLVELDSEMKLLKVKTARFADVVDQAGKPEPYTLWQKPAQDRHFQSALKNHRVMTIQKSESGTEFGMVGFKQSKTASYLIFPKSLKRLENKRITGIKWDLVK
jgi:hypothetical protein